MPPPPLRLNDNHRHSLLVGFQYIDRLLAEGLTAVSSDGDDGAVFSPVVPDATPVQRKVIADQAARLRRSIRNALAALDISIPPPGVSAIWSLRTHLISVEIALEELAPKYLRGYGPLDEATADGVNALLAQVRTVLTELERYLTSGLGGDLSARLARLDQTTDEVRLLRELERIVTAHGLAEFRQPLAQLLDRLEKNRWTVAFVGRVSCGKSSLLNYLLATDALPSGVTPVTAVPIRIVSGTEPFATVSFATEKPERVSLVQLGEFASEEKNPGNARHVTDILLELPAARLAGDVCFVDTPGLGSLATSGAAQTLAFLPRCDVGVLMIDAAATPTEEDVAVARSLLEDGAEVLLVISKADLLAPTDREKMRAYAVRQFATVLGRQIPVAPVSVATEHRSLAEEWWRAALAPRQARHRELAAVTLRRKVGALREAVVAALARRVNRNDAGRAAPATHAELGAVHATIENARRKAYEIPFKTIPATDEILDAAAPLLVGIEAGAELPNALARELGGLAARLAEPFEELLKGAREAAADALAAVRIGDASVVADLPRPASRPLFDPAPVLAAGPISMSWQRWPGAPARRAALRRVLRSQFASRLDDALRHYGRALVAWTHRHLDQLETQFSSQAGLIEAAAAPLDASETAAPSPEIVRDFEMLRDWLARPAA